MRLLELIINQTKRLDLKRRMSPEEKYENLSDVVIVFYAIHLPSHAFLVLLEMLARHNCIYRGRQTMKQYFPKWQYV